MRRFHPALIVLLALTLSGPLAEGRDVCPDGVKDAVTCVKDREQVWVVQKLESGVTVSLFEKGEKIASKPGLGEEVLKLKKGSRFFDALIDRSDESGTTGLVLRTFVPPRVSHVWKLTYDRKRDELQADRVKVLPLDAVAEWN